jgi:hypothetical protein
VAAYTDADVQAVSELLLTAYDSEYSSAGLTWRNFEDEARRYLDAVAPAIVARAKAEALREFAQPLLDDAVASGDHCPDGNCGTCTQGHIAQAAVLRADEIERT